MAMAATTTRGIRIETLHPTSKWSRIWRNLHFAWISDILRSAWYAAIHDILPTNDRIYRIALTDSYDCGVGKDMWLCTHIRLAMIFRTIASYIPGDRPFRPSSIWPRRDTATFYGSWRISYISACNTTTRQHYSTMLISCAKRAGKCTTCRNGTNELEITPVCYNLNCVPTTSRCVGHARFERKLHRPFYLHNGPDGQRGTPILQTAACRRSTRTAPGTLCHVWRPDSCIWIKK